MNPATRLPWLSLLFALYAAPAYALPTPDDYPKNPDIDAINYVFRLSLSDETDEIVGEATVDLRFLASGVTTLRLDLTNETPDGRGMTVTGVAMEGTGLTHAHEGDTLLITLPTASEKDQRSQITIRYRGVPATGLIIGDNKHGDRTFFSDNWPNKARNWLPTIDHPYDKAMCEFIVTAPDHYQVISNGLKVEETDLAGGSRLTHWKQSVPIASWLYVLGVARFAVQYVDTFNGKSIETWVYHQDRDAGFYDFAVPTKQAMAFYSDMVGPFSYEKLANVQSNSVGGGMEAATAIFYGDESVTGERSLRWRNVIIHEVAHQWFGNSVTEYDWDDVWLSEGFATYFTLLFIEHAYGRDAFVEGLKSSRERVLQFDDENPDYRIVHDNLTDMSRVTSSQTYQKGGWTLHMLRGVVGDAAFWRGIQSYYREFRDRNATTADFKRHMEEASGRSLDRFFQQWLHEPGRLRLDGGWSYDPVAGAVAIDVTQSPVGARPIEMPIQIGLYFAGQVEPRIEILQLQDLRQEFSIAAAEAPERVVLDPRTWALLEGDLVAR